MRQCRRIVGTSNGHRQGAGGCAAIGVVDGVGKGVSQTLADSPALHGRVVVIHRVGIAAVAGNVDLAIGSGYVATDAAGLHASHITCRNTLDCQRVSILIGVLDVAIKRTGRRHITAHAGGISCRHAFVDGGSVSIGNRQTVETYRDVLVCRLLATAALFLRPGCAAGRTTAGGIGVLVVYGDAQGNTGIGEGTRRGEIITIRDALQRGIDQCGGRCRTGKCQSKRTIRIGIGTNGGTIYLQNIACIQIQAGCYGARRSKDIVCTGSAGTGDGQHRTGPVVTCRQFKVTQCGIVVDTNR